MIQNCTFNPKYHHFKVSLDNLGVVVCNEFTHSSTETVDLKKIGVSIVQEIPEVIPPPGIPIDRQKYLYEQIRMLCEPEYADTTCPQPQSNHQILKWKSQIVHPQLSVQDYVVTTGYRDIQKLFAEKLHAPYFYKNKFCPLLTHSLLFHPILFCRITNNSIHFFSRHAKRSRDFDNKIFLTKMITILAELLAV